MAYTSLRGGLGAGCQGVTLAEPSPTCWNKPGFTDCMNEQLRKAQANCNNVWKTQGYCSYDNCVQQYRRMYQKSNCSNIYCDVGPAQSNETKCYTSAQCPSGLICQGAGSFSQGVCVAKVLPSVTVAAQNAVAQMQVSDASKYPWMVKAAATLELQKRVNAAGLDRWKKGLTKGYCQIKEDGILAAGTCGTGRANGIPMPTSCKEYATDCRGTFVGDVKPAVVAPRPTSVPVYVSPTAPVDVPSYVAPEPIYKNKALLFGIISGIVGAVLKTGM